MCRRSTRFSRVSRTASARRWLRCSCATRSYSGPKRLRRCSLRRLRIKIQQSAMATITSVMITAITDECIKFLLSYVEDAEISRVHLRAAPNGHNTQPGSQERSDKSASAARLCGPGGDLQGVHHANHLGNTLGGVFGLGSNVS